MIEYPNTKLRLYAFCNFYLNSISQGIQTAHVVGRMAKFYRHRDGVEARLFWDWLEENLENETIIVCNGGMAGDIFDAYMKFEPRLHAAGIPTHIFYEEPRALGLPDSKPAPTCWACVLPYTLYDAQLQRNDDGTPDKFVHAVDGSTTTVSVNAPGTSEVGVDLFEFLLYKNRCPLAR